VCVVHSKSYCKAEYVGVNNGVYAVRQNDDHQIKAHQVGLELSNCCN
jgi:hypothetical protein